METVDLPRQNPLTANCSMKRQAYDVDIVVTKCWCVALLWYVHAEKSCTVDCLRMCVHLLVVFSCVRTCVQVDLYYATARAHVCVYSFKKYVVQ